MATASAILTVSGIHSPVLATSGQSPVAGSFLAMTAAEGMVMQPLLIGRHIALNPVALLVNLLLRGWLWGVPGALLATPLLTVFKVLCDEVDELEPVGVFLER